MTELCAYPVPFRVERDPEKGTYLLTNESGETLLGVSFTLHGPGLMAVSPPRSVRPGYGVEVTIATRRARAILVVRWFRQSGVEYLWRVAF